MRNQFWLKVIISLGAFVFVLIHLLWPTLSIDAITLGLLVVVALPWLSTLIESAELPGGWKIRFRAVEDEVKQQRLEIDMLNFLVSHFLTDDEFTHLNKLDREAPFPFARSDSTDFFVQELHHLRAMKLIEGQQDKGIRSLLEQGGDVKQHFRITKRGRDYLRLREQAEAAEAKQKSLPG
jgi:hypothetical protein